MGLVPYGWRIILCFPTKAAAETYVKDLKRRGKTSAFIGIYWVDPNLFYKGAQK